MNVNNNRIPLRYTVLDDNAHILITLVVLIPVISTIILCVITACIYRFRKKRTPETSIDQYNAARSTMFHRSQINPFMIEELPPSYELISETKKDLSFIPKTYEQFDLSPIKNEMIMNTPPPPYNSNPSRSLNEN